mmetsp:Transcript_52461/g.93649  ORF Transcript_52461/g.93649 Transcript_52461/m.93649 type:complete len:84 (-) Transcript_52461:640-891(-)
MPLAARSWGCNPVHAQQPRYPPPLAQCPAKFCRFMHQAVEPKADMTPYDTSPTLTIDTQAVYNRLDVAAHTRTYTRLLLVLPP